MIIKNIFKLDSDVQEYIYPCNYDIFIPLKPTDDQTKNNKDTVNLIKQASESTTQKLSDIADAFLTLKNNSVSTAEDVNNIQQTGIASLHEMNITDTLHKFANEQIIYTQNNTKYNEPNKPVYRIYYTKSFVIFLMF